MKGVAKEAFLGGTVDFSIFAVIDRQVQGRPVSEDGTLKERRLCRIKMIVFVTHSNLGATWPLDVYRVQGTKRVYRVKDLGLSRRRRKEPRERDRAVGIFVEGAGHI